MFTLVLFHPLTGRGDSLAVIASGEFSVLIAMLVLALFPALSVAVPLKTSCAPAVVTWIGDGQEATPETASVQVKLMVTGSVSTLPLPPEDDVAAAVIAGEVLSRLTVTDVLAVVPPPA
jgi:hypothetical protein